jgi:hypothetical protein
MPTKGGRPEPFKEGLLSQIKSLDEKADVVGIDEEEWALRYHLEDQLLEVLERKKNTGDKGAAPVGSYRETPTPSTSMLWRTGVVGSAASPCC